MEGRENALRFKSTAGGQRRIQVRNHVIHFDKQSFAACCQAANIKAICSQCCISRVLTANKLALGQN